MRQMYRRGNYYTDIETAPLVSIIIIGVIFIIIFLGTGIHWLCQGDPHEVAVYNARVEAFNHLPGPERIAYQPLLNADLDDDGLLTLKETPRPFKVLFRESMRFFPLISLITLFVTSFIFYWLEKSKEYFLADLPLRTIYGWILLILILPAGWPFLLISLFRMRHYMQKQVEAEQREIRRLAGTIESENDPESVECDKNAQKTYIDFRTSNLAQQHSDKLSSLHEEIASQKRKITSYGNDIAKIQRELGRNNAKLKQLQANPPDQTATEETAKAEWQQILGMRGVSRINFPKNQYHAGDRDMEISIHVRVPYNGSIYDFGDYLVTFGNEFKCRQLRSGVKPDHTSSRPIYPDHDYGFCFGSRLSDIRAYANSSQIVEALTIIIDSLHSVNPEDEKYIPECYRKITTIKPTERQKKNAHASTQ